MSTKIYTEPFDFALYPFALGDTLTWCVRSAIRTRDAGRSQTEVLACLDPANPHCLFQDKPNDRQYQLVLSEVFPAFYTHPLLGSVTIFHDRAAFNHALEERAASGSLLRPVLDEYRETYAKRDNFEAVSRYFSHMLSEQSAINEFFARTRDIPWLREVVGCQADVENLIRAQGEDARIVTVQFRMRNLDRAIVANDFTRDVDYFTWERFLAETHARHPEVRFMLLGRLQEKPLSLLQLPNVIAPRLLGLNLGHELSLLMRSHLYFGSSSGFAQCAHFSHVPYRILNISQSACNTYGVPFGVDRLPFARPNQRLVYGKESLEQMFAVLDEALAEIKPEGKFGTGRTSRPNLIPAYAEDATTFRFVPDVRQAKHEIGVLSLTSLKRIIYSLNHNQSKEALDELEQLNYSLSQSTEGLAAPPPDLDHPTVNGLLRYWWDGALGKIFHLAGRPRTRVNFRKFTPSNSFHPGDWVVNGVMEYKRKRRPASLRFKNDQPNGFLKTEPFKMRRPGTLHLVFQARHPKLVCQHSNIYLFENGRYRIVATPLFTPYWSNFSFEFWAQPDADLNIQFDNNCPGEWLDLRNVFIGNGKPIET